jgi:cytochrome c-type biogenesis protein CcmH
MRKLKMSIRRVAAAVFALGLLAAPAVAVQPDEMLSDPKLEARARVLSAELRCLVCQNQSIDDSDASLAKDLRLLVRERIKGGDSDSQVLDYLVARYGEFVLLRPRFNAHTAILWTLPFGVLILGAAGIFVALRRRAARVGSIEAPLDAEEKARLARILGGEG